MYRHRSRFGTNELVLGAAALAVEGCYRWVGRHSEKGQTPQCRGKNESSLWLRSGLLKQGGSLPTSMTEL